MIVLLFARYPRAGSVKTRLSPPLSPDDACLLYRAFLLDSIQSSLSPGGDVHPVVLVADAEDVEVMKGMLDDEGFGDVDVCPQSNAELGVRLSNAFTEAFRLGATKVCALGTDHPTLPSDVLLQASTLLDDADVVLCPADDGGYCMIASSLPIPSLLLDMPYSTPDLAATVRGRASQQGLRLAELPVWYDVDDESGLARLTADINLAGARTQKVWMGLRQTLEPS